MDQHDFLIFFYLLFILISIGITIGVGFYTLSQRRVLGTRPFTISIFLEAAWTISYLIKSVSPTLEDKLFWDNVEWIPIFLLPLVFLALAQEYSENRVKNPTRGWMGLSIIPIFMLVSIFTNPLHGLAENSIQIAHNLPFPEITYNFGPLLWVGIVYSLTLTLWGIITLISHSFQQHGIFRIQTWIIILGYVIPTLGTIIGMVGLYVIPNLDLDLSPYSFAIANLLIAYGLFRYRLFDIVPFAHGQIMEKMEDGVIIVDGMGRILDINSASKNILNMPGDITVGQLLHSVFPGGLVPFKLSPATPSGHTEISLDQAGKTRFIDVGITQLLNQQGGFSGHMLILRDITARKQQEDEQRRDQDALEQRVYERTADLKAANDSLKVEVEQRRQAENEKEKQRSEMEILYKLMVELAALPVEADLQGIITTRLKQLTGAYVVAITEYNPAKKQLEMRGLEIDNSVIRKISSLLGYDIAKLSYPVTDTIYTELINNTVIYRQSLSQATFGVIPPATADIIQKLFNLKAFVGMVAQYQGELMGSFVLVLQGWQKTPSEWLLNALANVLSIIYRRKNAEVARLNSETRFQTLTDFLPQPIYECDLSGRITYTNRIGMEMFGYPTLEGKLSILDTIVESQREQATRDIQLILEGNNSTPKEYTALRKDGSTFPELVYTGQVIKDGQLVGLRGIVVDITELKTARA